MHEFEGERKRGCRSLRGEEERVHVFEGENMRGCMSLRGRGREGP